MVAAFRSSRCLVDGFPRDAIAEHDRRDILRLFLVWV
jgi:hypothetical protein